jgi:hypothetical protein
MEAPKKIHHGDTEDTEKNTENHEKEKTGKD